jgi:hypothetical protein
MVIGGLCIYAVPPLLLVVVVVALAYGEPGAAIAMILALVVPNVALVPVPKVVLGTVIEWALLAWFLAHSAPVPITLVWLAWCLLDTGADVLFHWLAQITRERLSDWGWSRQQLVFRASERFMLVDFVLLMVALAIGGVAYDPPRSYAVYGALIALLVYLFAQWQYAERRGLLASPEDSGRLMSDRGA